jgi:hypothetical protein
MIVYDNSERERVETLNKFHSNMRDVATSATASKLIVERNEDWKTMYNIYEKPERYWYSWFNKLLSGEPMYRKIGRVQIYDNSSVKIEIFKANEAITRIAQYLDKGDFRVTVVDKTAREI